jgi:hypothetical protein
MKTILAMAGGIFLLAAAGCGDGDPKKQSVARPADGGSTESAPSPAMFLRSRVDRDRVVVDVVAREVPDIHGAAFRVTWDSEKLGFAEAHASDVWSKDALSLAKEGLPGELVVAWSERGSTPGPTMKGETTLGTIELLSKTSDSVTIGFRPERSIVEDTKGEPVSLVWQGTTIERR